MSEAYSIKAGGKPDLSTWDIETEYQNVDRWIQSERKTDETTLERKRFQLRQLKLDFHDIILSGTVTEDQIERIFQLARNGEGGVWEQVTTAIQRLAFHFDLVKGRLTKELSAGDSSYVSKLVTSIDEFYNKNELREILTQLLKNKGKKVKERVLNKIFELRLIEMNNDLKQMRDTENDNRLIVQIDFTLKYIDTPKGRLSVTE